MSFWCVRAGKYGEGETYAFENSCVVIGWDEIADISGVSTRDQLRSLVDKVYVGETEKRRSIWTGELWAFARTLENGDLVALPRKDEPLVAFGEVVGPYRFDAGAPEGCRHQRPVRWINLEFPRSALEEDIRYSLGSTLAVFQVRRERAEERMRAKLRGESIPTLGSEEIPSDESSPINIQQLAQDQIADLIGRRFRGHALEALVADILRAQGFVTDRNSPGADGGVDILAGRGRLGLEQPRLAVQVKSSDTPVDVNGVRELQGLLKMFGADMGLYVSWGGYRGTVKREARRDFFQLRLWDSTDLINELLANYDNLSDEIRAQLPLERVWAVLQEGVDE